MTTKHNQFRGGSLFFQKKGAVCCINIRRGGFLKLLTSFSRDDQILRCGKDSGHSAHFSERSASACKQTLNNGSPGAVTLPWAMRGYSGVSRGGFISQAHTTHLLQDLRGFDPGVVEKPVCRKPRVTEACCLSMKRLFQSK